MIVCYAEGGGLGHLTRVVAYLATVHPGRPATILSSSPHARDTRVTGGHRVIVPPAGLWAGSQAGLPAGTRTGLPAGPPTQALTGWLRTTLAELAPSEWVVDAFPLGLRGELTGDVVPTGTRVTHLARLLRWDTYLTATAPPGSGSRGDGAGSGLMGPPLHFDRTWCLEPLHSRHRLRLDEVSAEVCPLRLVDPVPAPARGPEGISVDIDPEGISVGSWLVVHGGPPAEVEELLRYARDMACLEGVRPRIVLVSGCDPTDLSPELLVGVTRLTAHPAWPLFAQAERVVTAAGFNAVRQLAPWRERHRMMPFARRFDDQFTRARDARVRHTHACRVGTS